MELFFGFLLLAIAGFSASFIFVIKRDSESSNEIIPSATLGALTMILFILSLFLISEYCSPSITPMDVYRGKTTLEITYRDSVAVDSVVVWKEE